MKQIKTFVLTATIVQTVQFVLLLKWLSVGKSAIYGTNDDSLISSISSGQLTGNPDPHLIFIQPLISYPIIWLETLLRNYSGYSVFLILVSTFSFTLILALIISTKKLNTVNFTFWFSSNLIFQSWFSLNPSYTGASLFAAGAAAGFILSLFQSNLDTTEGHRKFLWVISSLLTILCFGIRKEGIYILLILVVPIILHNFKDQIRDANTIKFFFFPIIILLTFNGLISNTLYKNVEWKEFNKMNNLRHQIQLRSPEVKILEKIDELGWSKDTYVMFTRFSLLDKDQMNSVEMQQILDLTDDFVGPKSLLNSNFANIPITIKEAFNPWTWILTYILVIMILHSLRSYFQSNLRAFLLLNGTLILSIMLLLVVLASGYQIPERISLNLLAGISLALITTTLNSNKINKRLPTIINLVLIILVLAISGKTLTRFALELEAREGFYKTRQVYALQQSNSLSEQGSQIVISNASGLKSHWRYPYQSWVSFDSRNKTIILGWQNLSPISRKQFINQGLNLDEFPKGFIDSRILWVDSPESIVGTAKFLAQYSNLKIGIKDMGPVGNDEYHYYQFVESENL